VRIVAGVRPQTLWGRYVGGAGLTLTLALLLVLTVTYPIQKAEWVENMAPVTLIGVLGIILATVLHEWDTRPAAAHAAALGIGILVVFFAALVMTPGISGSDRALSLFNELEFWIEGISTDETRGGLVEFGSFLVGVSWFLGYGAAWMALRRQQGWVPVLVGGSVLSIALVNISDGALRSLVLFMLAAALLLIHLATAQRMVGWRAKRLYFEPATVLSQSGILLGAGVVVILLVSMLPSPGVKPLGFVGEAFEDTAATAGAHFGRLFNGLPSRRSFRTITYREETQFRGNPNLTDDLLFTVAGDTQGYWRARTYTSYTGTGWDTSGAEFGEFEPPDTEDLARAPVSHEFKIEAATDTLFSSGIPLEHNRPVQGLAFDDSPDDTLQVRIAEGLEYFPTRTNLRYRSTGLRSLAGPPELRDAGLYYPQEVANRYLQLPVTLPSRVYDLAIDLTAGLDNPFDKVNAIRAHVQSLPYNLEISAPPAGRDGVDYFLFDLRQGYCDYYASSTAVLLRAVGIPARYVVGYASGRFDGDSQSYQVLDLNYHSWVEVYFPDYGWVLIEATPEGAIEFQLGSAPVVPSSSPIEIDLGDGPIPEDEEEEGAGGFGDLSPGGGSIFGTAWIIGLLAVGLGTLLATVYYRWWWRLRRLSRADEVYAKMQRLTSLLGMPPRPEQTPKEYAELLGREVPEAQCDFDELARVYMNRRYSGKLIPMSDLRSVDAAWSRLRWTLIKRMFRARPA
jgi:transglutaminase-like putative cysteine protease